MLGQQADDAGDIRDEAHVQHAIGFVENERLHAAEVEALLFDQVEQASRCCHEHFDTGADFFDLWLDVDAAVSAQASYRDVLAVGLDRLVYLDGEFARRREHQDPHRMARWRRTWAGKRKDALEKRQREGRRFTRSGLRTAHQILARENDRDGLRLNRRRVGVTLFSNGSQDFRRQAEFIKTHRQRP